MSLQAAPDNPLLEEFTVNCHCGRVQGRFHCSSTGNLWAWECNCSDCHRRGNVHLIVPQSAFQLDMTVESLEQSTVLYQWGTHKAVRRFCATCGILPWYVPRSNPDCYAITINCVDWTKGGTRTPPTIQIKKFDGVHWEDTMAKLAETR